jgi:hypothetical protein
MADRSNPGPLRRFNEALSWLWASCERVTMSESRSHDGGRPLWERLTVNAHQISCPGCRRFRGQTRSLGGVLGRLRARRESGDKLPGLCLPPDVRERIKAALKRARDPGGPALPGSPPA